MGANWRPLSVLDVRGDMAEIGLEPAGSAWLIENFDDYVLGKAAQKLLATVDDPDLHELVRDYLLNTSFRRDVFVRQGVQLSDADRRRRLLAAPFALAAPKRRAVFRVETAAGEINFDNPIARRMVSALAAGPRRLGELVEDGIGAADILSNAMILAGARVIRPVEAGGQRRGGLQPRRLRSARRLRGAADPGAGLRNGPSGQPWVAQGAQGRRRQGIGGGLAAPLRGPWRGRRVIRAATRSPSPASPRSGSPAARWVPTSSNPPRPRREPMRPTDPRRSPTPAGRKSVRPWRSASRWRRTGGRPFIPRSSTA